MVNCLMCGDELRSTTADTLCPSCRPLYKVSRSTVRQVIPSDCIAKDDFRKLVEEYKWLYHEGESLRALYLKLEKLTGGDAIEQDK